MTDDARHMAHALALGRRGQGQVWPNPAVGCVIVTGDRVVGRGWTAPGGRPHAEALALAQAGPAAPGATAYVTLEPCAHLSRRGPACADLLIAAGVARVVTAMTDPDPRTAGQGHGRLLAAGLAVTTGVLEAEARDDHAGFLIRLAQGRPRVTLKLAASLDGRIATASGESRWITGPAARASVHALRARHDAVMVGGGTARTDDPLLTVRGMGPVRPPVRVVWSRALDLSPRGALAQSADGAPLWLLHEPGQEAGCALWQRLGAVPIAVPAENGALCPAAALQALGARGLTRVLCEGGGALAASLLGADLVDEIVVMTAGLAIGGDGRAMVGALGVDHLAAAPRFRLIGSRGIAGDLVHRWSRA